MQICIQLPKVNAVASFFVHTMRLSTRMTQPFDTTIAAWTALVSVNRSLVEDIERHLKAQDLPQLSWYDALLELEKVGANGIRPFELKDRLLLPQYGLSRLLDRLVAAGFVERLEAQGDGRGQIVRLTTQGRAMRTTMWPVYAARLRDRIEATLTPQEAADLARLLNKLRS